MQILVKNKHSITIFIYFIHKLLIYCHVLSCTVHTSVLAKLSIQALQHVAVTEDDEYWGTNDKGTASYVYSFSHTLNVPFFSINLALMLTRDTGVPDS